MKKSLKIGASLIISVCTIATLCGTVSATDSYKDSTNISNEYSGLSNKEIAALNLKDSEEMTAIIAEKDKLFNRRLVYPNSYSISVNWQQQINGYYCGPATACMILSCISTPATQSQIAGSNYLRTNELGDTPWFSGGSDMETAGPQYYNMSYGINQWQYYQTGHTEWTYAVYPYNGAVPTVDGYFTRIKASTYMDYPVAVFVVSNTNQKFHNKYPNTSLRHWVVCYGWNGNYISICDPASGISGFGSVPQKYQVNKSMLGTNSWGIVY